MNTNTQKPLQIAYIVPVHNDASSIHHCFEQFHEALKHLTNPLIVMVENGSRDNSFEAAQKLAQESLLSVYVFLRKMQALVMPTIEECLKLSSFGMEPQIFG